MTWSGLRTCRPSTSWMSRAWTVPGPSLSMRTVYVFAVRRLEDDLLQVEDDVGHVLDDVADGRELVERALDADAR